MSEFQGNRRSEKRGSYKRDMDCWNCGLPFHISKHCTAKKTLRCSYCRKQGVRSDECHCRRNRREGNMTRSVSPSPSSAVDKFEAAVLVTVCKKRVRAVIRSGVQESRIGNGVFELINKNGRLNPKRKVIKTITGLELAQTVMINVSIKENQKYNIECVIDRKIPKNEMSLGLKAMVKLGFRISIAGQECRTRKITMKRTANNGMKRDRGVKNKDNKEEDNDDDRISFLDEQEAKRIEEWSY